MSTEATRAARRERARRYYAGRPDRQAAHRAAVRKSMQKRRREDPDYERKQGLQKNYGITVEWYDAVLAAQDFACAICKKPEIDNTRRQGKAMRLSVDHCHTSGKVGGLLCNDCNRALGLFGDSVGNLQSAAAYLLAHRLT